MLRLLRGPILRTTCATNRVADAQHSWSQHAQQDGGVFIFDAHQIACAADSGFRIACSHVVVADFESRHAGNAFSPGDGSQTRTSAFSEVCERA